MNFGKFNYMYVNEIKKGTYYTSHYAPGDKVIILCHFDGSFNNAYGIRIKTKSYCVNNCWACETTGIEEASSKDIKWLNQCIENDSFIEYNLINLTHELW